MRRRASLARALSLCALAAAGALSSSPASVTDGSLYTYGIEALAARVADPRWEVTVLLHLSDVLDRFGDRDDAVNLQTRALRLMSSAGSSAAPDPMWLPGLGRLADS